MDQHAADYARYFAGPDVADELMPLPDGAEDRQQLLAQSQADRAGHQARYEEDYSIEQWCADNAYDATVAAWLRTQE